MEGHKNCSIEIKESTAYRHMKYGISSSEKAPSRRVTKSDPILDSDSEQDL